MANRTSTQCHYLVPIVGRHVPEMRSWIYVARGPSWYSMLITLLKLPFDLPVSKEKPVADSSCSYTGESIF